MRTIKTARHEGKMLRNHINKALNAVGFDENGQFKTPGAMLGAMMEALQPLGLSVDTLGLQLPSADLSPEQIAESGQVEGRATLPVHKKVSDDPFDPGQDIGELQFSWLYKPDVDVFKALAYMPG